DASWTIANQSINSDSIIYSFGVGTDISFDLDLIKKYNVDIHAFDPTPKSIEWVKKQNITQKFIMHEHGLAAFTGSIEFTLPDNPEYISGSIDNMLGSAGNTISISVKDLKTIMNDLSHSRIDILKMDIEGSEYDVIDDLISNKIIVQQLLIEFHHRFPKIGIKKTKEAIKKLNNYGFKIFHISNNGEEYSFIKD
ncbi:FkbM family methyltransferase, partial [Bacteroidota bacterium]